MPLFCDKHVFVYNSTDYNTDILQNLKLHVIMNATVRIVFIKSRCLYILT